MMTKESGAAGSAPTLVTSSAATVLKIVTLPTSMATAQIGNNILHGAVIKEETEDEYVTIAAGGSDSSDISNVRATHTTLQSLLAAPISTTRLLPHQLDPEQTIQVITLPSNSNLITTSQPDGAGRIWQVVPHMGSPDMATIIAVADPAELMHTSKSELGEGIDLDIQEAAGELSVTNADTMAAILMPPPPPADCPPWASRLNNCEKIGESYRGYVESEVELDLLLTYHKQQTSSFWGTRQSPSPAKPSTRLMWKSQYVPFDGIPFVNIGSRAVVMECQYGPRRKGNASKRYSDGSQANQYRQTCPARIYIKRVRKFPEYAVDLRQDKKVLRMAMDKAFHELRERRLEGMGVERFYIQLPTEKGHEFHDDMGQGVEKKKATTVTYEASEIITAAVCLNEAEPEGVRLHPKIVNKIRDLVASGETRIYAIRRHLRSFVLRELFAGSDKIPERHDLTLFPTVNDLKNHLHQAIKDIENGSLGVTATTVNVELLQGEGGENVEELDEGDQERLSALLERGMNPSLAMPETVTVTLTQNPDADGHHIISRIETHLSDGTTQVSTTLTPETAQLLSKLHPAIFPADSLMQLGSSPSSDDLAGTASDLDSGVGAHASADSSDSAAAIVMATGEGLEDASSEVLHVVSPDQLLQVSTGEEQAVVPVQMAVAGEDSVMVSAVMDDDAEKAGESVLVSDTDMITISMTDDNQLVLAAPVPETFDAQ
ncbi:calcium-responsive transcription factor-like [Littorina saxatilis]|uniref:Calcium-responsive transcription factor n=1 Tax=Littorina saxatilis TaxID=31220 RepID=A0AAN9BP05_9CAEN